MYVCILIYILVQQAQIQITVNKMYVRSADSNRLA